MADPKKIDVTLDTVISVLTKSNVIASIAGVAVAGIIKLFRDKGMPVPDFTQEELNAAMHASAQHVIDHAEELKAQIRAEFPNA